VKRDPMIFSVAGLLFGFVLGYMVANAGRGAPAPRVANAAAAEAPAPPGAPAAPPAAGPGPLDPSEVRALAALAQREEKNLTVRVELGNLLMDHGQDGEAVRWYREALAIDPSQIDVRVDLGACLVRLGKHEEALAEFDQAIQQNPAHKKAAYNKGVALMESGKPKEAVAVWDDLLKRFPDDPQLRPLKEQVERLRQGRS
jgi:tetratricopeptide (TPR) repeat protein